MSSEGGSQADRELLARLNALKKTHIDFNDTKYKIPVAAHIPSVTDLAPAEALHGDLVSRFKSLNGQPTDRSDQAGDNGDNNEDPLAEEDSKTIEELLSELGGEGAWNLEKAEATQIDDLLQSANVALNDAQSSEKLDPSEDLISGNDRAHELPSIDIELSHPKDLEDQDISDDETPHKSKRELEAEVDREADDIVARLKDELQNDPSASDEDETGQQTTATSMLPATPSFDLPSTPSKDPDPSSADTDLASRFASLNLPTAPPTLPSTPSSKPGKAAPKFGASAHYAGHTDEDIESWCVICCEDATLRCLGCDGDLYCAKCWIDGHRGPDAGYEERRHRAVEYNKGVKKEPRRRVAA